jgi:uncharacterized protein (DUF58 family)
VTTPPRASSRSRSSDKRAADGTRPRRRGTRGRAPALTARGQAWAIGGALLLVGGALLPSWRVAGLGLLVLASLCAVYLSFYPTSVLIWRRHLELQWGLHRSGQEGGFVAGRPFRLVVTLRNRAPRALGKASLRVFASKALDTPNGLHARLGARSEVTVVGEVTARLPGAWYLHGAATDIGDALGLCSVEAYFPSPLAVNVLPRPLRTTAAQRPASGGAPHERQGPHALRARGVGGDLRELRDHMPGDPFKNIAWKATARLGKLMVREFDHETLLTHFVLVDIGPTMREGPPGARRLDLAIDMAASYARDALAAGDRVGLITFDGRIIAEVKPNDGPVHRLRLYEPLLEATNAVDDDLTELSDSELVAVVARYLHFQQGIDATVATPPPIDHPSWAHLSTAPTGELYDVRVLVQAVAQVAATPVLLGRGQTQVRAATPELASLRLFCRRRGLELPYRRATEEGRRAAGLAAALERAAAGRGTQRLVVLSDLLGLDGNLEPLARAVRLVRRRGHHLICAAPAPRRDLGRDSTDAARVAQIARWEERRRDRVAYRRMAALGVRVVPIRPGEAEMARLAVAVAAPPPAAEVARRKRARTA